MNWWEPIFGYSYSYYMIYTVYKHALTSIENINTIWYLFNMLWIISNVKFLSSWMLNISQTLLKMDHIFWKFLTWITLVHNFTSNRRCCYHCWRSCSVCRKEAERFFMKLLPGCVQADISNSVKQIRRIPEMNLFLEGCIF